MADINLTFSAFAFACDIDDKLKNIKTIPYAGIGKELCSMQQLARNPEYFWCQVSFKRDFSILCSRNTFENKVMHIIRSFRMKGKYLGLYLPILP